MRKYIIQLTEEQAAQVQEKATQQQISVEQFLQEIIVSQVNSSNTDFNDAVDKVLNKNTELYRRLAQ